MQALQGIKVLDLTRLLPGPYCSMFLADFGAEVIKVEQPGEGDYARWYKPLRNGIGYRHIILNRNKKSITLDLKQEQGQAIFFKMIEDADVIIESFRPEVMRRLGVDYETVKAVNPRIVYCSLTGFGQTGPYKMAAGHDLNYISLAGITSLTGERAGKPQIPGIQIADLTGGLMAALGILVALQSRNQTGAGQYIDISLFSAALAMLPSDASLYFGGEQIPRRGESRLTGGLPQYAIYQTRDGRHLAVGALEKKFWRNLCAAINREELIDAIDDKSCYEDLFSILEELFAGKTLSEWEQVFAGKDVCVTPVRQMDEVFDDPQVKANGMLVELTDEKLGDYRQLGIPIKLSATPGRLEKRAPDLGEHTEEILRGLGYTEQDIAVLISSKTI